MAFLCDNSSEHVLASSVFQLGCGVLVVLRSSNFLDLPCRNGWAIENHMDIPSFR